MSNRPISTIVGGRASFAFSEVKKFVDTHREHAKDYRSYVKKMPAMIQVNGLGQTLAFYYSKKNKKAYYEIYQTITSWLKKEFPQFFAKEQTLVEVVINLDSSDYRMFTMEVMALLNWMRKFVDGMVEVKEGESKNGIASN